MGPTRDYVDTAGEAPVFVGGHQPRLSRSMPNTEATEEHPVRVEIDNGIGLVTMHRPEARNAINPAMRRAIRSSIALLEEDEQVAVIVLTGTDPAFCAGIDLKLLASAPSQALGGGGQTGSVRPFPPLTKPLIGAINGPAITGGFELALNCDFLIASTRAVFADTHARVGVMPGWGLTALLSDAVGRRRAREISLTGNFVTAQEALQWGLVNRVVAHEDLLPTVLRIAADVAGNDQVGVARMLGTYASQECAALSTMWDLESEGAAAFARATTPGADVAGRRQAIIDRGRAQISRN